MRLKARLLLTVLSMCIATAWGQSNKREPHIGYLYPAGGQRGSVFQVMIGGQNLRGVTDVYISGEGVRSSVVDYYRPVRFNGEQRQELRRRLNERRDILTGKKVPGKDNAGNKENRSQAAGGENTVEKKPVKLPDHPLLRNLDKLNLRELAHVRSIFSISGRKKQLNRQIADTVLIEVTIDPGAALGNRELRLKTPLGLTNPMCFQIGRLPEISELEPNNDSKSEADLPEEPLIDTPILLNGQILPGDIDRFRIRAMKGQKLVIEARARQLIPYLADAVPGWFQATLTLFDAEGNEVAFADDYRFNPDPVLFYKIPADGEYVLEIRDAIYRGREDFVYRVTLSEQPFITQVFPLGGRKGVKTFASMSGWNVPERRLFLDTQNGTEGIRQAVLQRGKKWLSNQIPYAVDSLPECFEKEHNDTTQDAQPITLGQIVNGRILSPDDIDVFRFDANSGDEVIAEVYARRLNSPLDSLLRLTDDSNSLLEWNDDHEDKEAGLLTHHADSYLYARLPKDGTYYVHLKDTQNHGGRDYGYRLHIGPPRPNFALRVAPASINVFVGRAACVRVYAFRTEGFEGDINLELKNAPAGFQLSGGRIPAGRDSVRVTLTAPRQLLGEPVVLQMEGSARINGQIVNRPVVPAEDMMQAFIYRHLVPAQKLMVAVTGKRPPPLVFTRADSKPVRIPVGGSVRVLMKTRRRPLLNYIQLELNEPPEGITLRDVIVVPDGLAFRLKADGDTERIGFKDNLIVEVFREFPPQQEDGKSPKEIPRNSWGFFPAIPCEIVPR